MKARLNRTSLLILPQRLSTTKTSLANIHCRDAAEILLSYASESPFVQYENGGVRDIDHVIVKCAGARKRRPIAPRRHHYVGLTQERAKRLVDGVPKPIFHPVSGVGIPD